MAEPTPSAETPVVVLLVEDNPGDIRLARDLARQCETPIDLHVVTAGEEALAFLRREGRHAGAAAVDLVILDLYLPGKSGRDVLAEIKRDPALKHLPVVVISSMFAPEDVDLTDRLGANRLLTKPLSVAALTEALPGTGVDE